MDSSDSEYQSVFESLSIYSPVLGDVGELETVVDGDLILPDLSVDTRKSIIAGLGSVADDLYHLGHYQESEVPKVVASAEKLKNPYRFIPVELALYKSI